ncbi:nucleoside deaminase [Gracilimonas sp. Q87]|uniref:nucleoside deaminase n=1 Tax=Gracilimonas sp. Q87 TaxID=3384766 RepID=UPI00398454B4
MNNRNRILHECFDLAKQAKGRGDGAFGAIIQDENGTTIARAGNTTGSDGSVLYHAETNAIKKAESKKGKGKLKGCILYSSAEPCPMCASAIVWAGIDAVVYGVSIEKLREIGIEQIDLNCFEVFRKANRKIDLQGPFLEGEGLLVF